MLQLQYIACSPIFSVPEVENWNQIAMDASNEKVIVDLYLSWNRVAKVFIGSRVMIISPLGPWTWVEVNYDLLHTTWYRNRCSANLFEGLFLCLVRFMLPAVDVVSTVFESELLSYDAMDDARAISLLRTPLEPPSSKSIPESWWLWSPFMANDFPFFVFYFFFYVSAIFDIFWYIFLNFFIF